MRDVEMLSPDTRISLADLAAAGVKLRPPDAVAIVHELVLQVSRDDIPGVPSPHVIRIAPSGELFVEGPVAAGSRPVSRAAQLLETLLPPFDAAPDLKVPGALRLVLARAMGTLDVPPYESLEAFAQGLQRFSAPDRREAMRGLVHAWASAAERAARQHAPLVVEVATSQADVSEAPATTELVRSPEHAFSVSDIRRARRATGLPLAEIASRSRIPVELLRQLEWGYVRHWPLGLYGRTQLVRYARAAGLDEQLVVQAMWPMLEEGAGDRATEPVESTAVPGVIVESVPVEAVAIHSDIAEIPLMTVPPGALPARRSKARVGAWLAVAAALLLAVLPLVRHGLEGDQPQQTDQSIAQSMPQSVVPGAPAALGSTGETPGVSGTTASPDAAVAATDTSTAPTDSAPPVAEPAPQVAAKAPASPEREQTETEPARRLTEDERTYSPAFATEGSAVFYQAENDRGSALMRADTDGEGSILRITRVVDDNARNFHARPSPDGARIAFDSDREGERGVYIAKADGTAVKRVSGEGYALVPTWSPDNRTLAFVKAEPGAGAEPLRAPWNLWTVDLDNGDMRRLTSHKYGQTWGGSWFPDGRRIAYSHETRLIVLDLETGREKIFESPRKGRLVRTPAVSPDGRRIIFQVYRDGAWLLDLRDGSMRKVLADPTAEEYSWSPDGMRVAYHSRRSGQWGVWLMMSH